MSHYHAHRALTELLTEHSFKGLSRLRYNFSFTAVLSSGLCGTDKYEEKRSELRKYAILQIDDKREEHKAA